MITLPSIFDILLLVYYVKAVLVDTFSGDSTVKAAETAAVKPVIPKVDDSGLSGELNAEAVDHGLKLTIVLLAVGENDHIAGLFGTEAVNFFAGKCLIKAVGKGHRHVFGRRKLFRNGLIAVIFYGPANIAKKLSGIILSFIGEQVVHMADRPRMYFMPRS